MPQPQTNEAAALQRTRTVTWADPAETARAAAGMDRLAALRALISGELPPPPIASVMGFQLLEVEPGRAVFGLEPAEWMYNPMRIVHGGVAATILDTCMGVAVASTTPEGVGHTTSDLQVGYLRPLTAESGRVLAEGKVVHAGERTAITEGTVTVEATGKLAATATSAYLFLR
jgi:uncharacterized protein (TIGR00369 family)